DIGAFLGEGDGHGPADTGITPGDQGPLVTQQAPPFVAVHLVPGLRHHRLGAPRVLLTLGGRCCFGHGSSSYTAVEASHYPPGPAVTHWLNSSFVKNAGFATSSAVGPGHRPRWCRPRRPVPPRPRVRPKPSAEETGAHRAGR